jgi:hypothetical protein
MPNLTRPNYPTPEFIRKALDERGLLESYHNRPAYQQMITSAGSGGLNGRKPNLNA